ncbi:MAG TPA: helical backbone metal receptor [Ohtaekwangia sp.]|nr:helical backbone metal receptor [Ohtaekwangia sp.]
MQTPKTVTDQLGERITFPFPPKRIISLVPSQTEWLASLALDQEVIGITKFCIHPSVWYKTKIHIGGTKNFSFEAIAALKPDLVIGNKEENYPEGIYRLRNDFPVWMSDIYSLDDALKMMIAVAEIAGKTEKANALLQKIKSSFEDLKPRKKRSVLYLIWRKPWMAVGKNTFIDDMLSRNGFVNILEEERYPEITADSIQSLKPDLVFLSSEPYPFRERHAEEIKSLFPDATTVLVDGEMFSWYGSRLLLAPAYFENLRF